MLTNDNQIDLTIALKKFHELQLENGDLGAAYWYDVAQLLKWANEKRNTEIKRAKNSELKRAQIRTSKTVKTVV